MSVTRFGAAITGCAAVVAIAAACSSSSNSTTATPTDGGTSDSGSNGGPDPSKSICGHPGDVGNAFGVGKFCTSTNDCASNSKATFCAIIGDDRAFFCTFVCDPDGGADQCGAGAECTGQGGPTGCFPIACDESSKDAGTDADAGSDASDASTD